jgi:hypothetical protein
VSHLTDTYTCTSAHTSKFNFEPQYWSGGGGTTWKQSTEYNVGNTVSYRGATLNCIKSHTSKSYIEIIYWDQPGQPVPAFELSEIHFRDNVSYSLDFTESDDSPRVEKIKDYFGSNNHANFKKLAVQVSSIMYPGGAQADDVFRFGTNTLTIKIKNDHLSGMWVPISSTSVQRDYTIFVNQYAFSSADWNGMLEIFAHEMAHTFQFGWSYGVHRPNFKSLNMGLIEGHASYVSGLYAKATSGTPNYSNAPRRFTKWDAGYSATALFLEYIANSGYPNLVNDIQNEAGKFGSHPGMFQDITGKSVETWWELYNKRYNPAPPPPVWDGVIRKWTQYTRYSVGTVVSHLTDTYTCTSAHTSKFNFEPQYWKKRPTTPTPPPTTPTPPPVVPPQELWIMLAGITLGLGISFVARYG